MGTCRQGGVDPRPETLANPGEEGGHKVQDRLWVLLWDVAGSPFQFHSNCCQELVVENWQPAAELSIPAIGVIAVPHLLRAKGIYHSMSAMAAWLRACKK